MSPVVSHRRVSWQGRTPDWVVAESQKSKKWVIWDVFTTNKAQPKQFIGVMSSTSFGCCDKIPNDPVANADFMRGEFTGSTQMHGLIWIYTKKLSQNDF